LSVLLLVSQLTTAQPTLDVFLLDNGGKPISSSSYSLHPTLGSNLILSGSSSSYSVASGIQIFGFPSPTGGSPPIIDGFQRIPARIFYKGDAPKEVRVSVTDDGTIVSVRFLRRKFRSDAIVTVEDANPEGSNIWSAVITEQDLDELGMGYIWIAIDDESLQAFDGDDVFKGYSEGDNETNIPSSFLGSGGTRMDWRMFSIPHTPETATVQSIFINELGSSDGGRNWRLLRYNPGTNNFTDLSNSGTLKRGEGYWFNSRVELPTISLGTTVAPPETLISSATETYIIPVQTGWNQIGNPYPFDVPWGWVTNANPGLITNTQYWAGTSERNFTDFPTFEAFGGAYVEVNSSTNLLVPYWAGYIPPMPVEDEEGHLSGDSWNLRLILNSGEYENLNVGVGMRPDASERLDAYDRKLGLPHFYKFQGRFLKEDRDGSSYVLRRDIVCSSEFHVWDFTIESDLGEPVQLSWDNSWFGNNDFQLILVDQETQALVNLREQNRYVFTDELRDFKLYYGLPDKISEELVPNLITLGSPYPNPSYGQIRIPFTLPEIENSSNFNIRITIYDMLGNQVTVLANQQFGTGFYEIQWNGLNAFGDEMPVGIYNIVMQAGNNNRKVTRSQKVVRK